jgi:solute:Na+ symporter, SSS family
MGHLHLMDLVTMGLYALVILAIGWGYSARNKTSEDYFVAGRRARSWIVGVSMISALFSTISFLAYPGELIRNGPGLAFAFLHSPFTYIIVGYFAIPHIMRYRITSGYELLEDRFGLTVRKTASLLFIFVRLLWMGLVLWVCSGAVSEMTEIPRPTIMVCVGVVTIAYTVLGGMRAVLLVDVIQFMIYAGSGLLVISYVTYLCGGMGWLFHWDTTAIADLQWPKVKAFSTSPFERLTIVTVVMNASLWWICTATSDQMMIQRYLCTKDAKTARRSFLHCLMGDFLMSAICWGLAAALLAYYLRFGTEPVTADSPLVRSGDRLFPTFMANVLPPGIRGLLVAAMFSDVMQSVSSGISALGTVLVVDFKSIFARGLPAARPEPVQLTGSESSVVLDNASMDNRVLSYATPINDVTPDPVALAKRAKLVGIGVGTIALSLSFAIGYIPARGIIDITQRMSGYFTVPLAVVFLMAFFVPFATPAGAWTAIVAGFISGVLFSYWEQIFGIFNVAGEFSIVLIMPCTLLISLVSGTLISLVTTRRPRRGFEPALQ